MTAATPQVEDTYLRFLEEHVNQAEEPDNQVTEDALLRPGAGDEQRHLGGRYYHSSDSHDDHEREGPYPLTIRGIIQLEMFPDARRRRRLQRKLGNNHDDDYYYDDDDYDSHDDHDDDHDDEPTNADINAFFDATETFFYNQLRRFGATRGKVKDFRMGHLESQWFPASEETDMMDKFLITFRAQAIARRNSGLRAGQVARAMNRADFQSYITDYLWEEQDGDTPWFETQKVEYEGKPVIQLELD